MYAQLLALEQLGIIKDINYQYFLLQKLIIETIDHFLRIILHLSLLIKWWILITIVEKTVLK